jgi:hypothetical protein
MGKHVRIGVIVIDSKISKSDFPDLSPTVPGAAQKRDCGDK